MRWQSKRAGSVRDYTHDWSVFLEGDSIATSTFTVVGGTKDSENNSATTATVVISGGTAGEVIEVTNEITTVGGREESAVFYIPIISADEPISLQEAKAHLRKTDSSEDALIESYIIAAREWVENYTSHVLQLGEITDTYTVWGNYLRLAGRPVSSLVEVNYTAVGGAETVYADARLWNNGHEWRVYPPYGGTFPELGEDPVITATYLAGFLPGKEPEALRVAMLILVAHWFTNRTPVGPGDMKEVPLSVKSLCGKARGVVAV